MISPAPRPILDLARGPISGLLALRPDLFGDAYRATLQRVMRGPSAWSVGERELFAAWVSSANSCRY